MRIKYFLSILTIFSFLYVSDGYTQTKGGERTKRKTERSIERQKRKEDRQLNRDRREHKKKQTKQVQERMDKSRKKADKFNRDKKKGIIERIRKKRKVNKL